MFHDLRAGVARTLEWFLRRNPMYLASAALMAVGARLFLVDPNTAPGDIKLILITLVVLQFYEWAVSTILILLHQSRRSPEDKPSLLLITVLFWTGPMAATIEMTVLRPALGLSLAIGVCLIALGVLRYVVRQLQIHTTSFTKIAGSACVLFLALVPPLLRATNGPGPNELYLYGASWLLAAILMLGIATIRGDHERKELAGTPSLSTLNHEMSFLAITIGCTAIHGWGMNHAFFCHARWFYLSPLIVAASVVFGEYMWHTSRRNDRWMHAVQALPLLAILLASQDFDGHVPVHMLPHWLHDPLIPIALITGFAWWHACLRQKQAWFFHAGTTAVAFAIYRVLRLSAGANAGLPLAANDWLTQRNIVAAILFASAAYFAASALIRRNRHEVVAALLLNLIAVSIAVWKRTPADLFLIAIAVGWSWLATMHLYLPRAPLICRLVPLAFVAIVSCANDFNVSTMWFARLHTLGVAMALFTIGSYWRWTSYRSVALVLCGIQGTCVVFHWTGRISNPLAVAIVVVSFLLLATGVVISWNKQRLLNSCSEISSMEVVPEHETNE